MLATSQRVSCTVMLAACGLCAFSTPQPGTSSAPPPSAACASTPLAAAASTPASSTRPASRGDVTVALAPSSPVQSIFHISKSENRNQVHYTVQVDAACRPLGPRPVYGYWREFERGARVVSPLLDLEQAAYGVSEQGRIRRYDSGGELELRLRGFPERPLSIATFRQAGGCRGRATTRIAKQPAVLTSIYVKIGFLFSVEYALLRGVRLADGARVEEKLAL